MIDAWINERFGWIVESIESQYSNISTYRLDPCHYYSSPGLNWDAMLKMTGIKLEKISEIGKYLFIEKGLKGGISCIAK